MPKKVHFVFARNLLIVYSILPWTTPLNMYFVIRKKNYFQKIFNFA